MLARYVSAFLLVAGAASAAPAAPGAASAATAADQDALMRGKTTVADVEQSLGAPMDTQMRPDGALTLVYTYGRCAHRLPATFPSLHGSDANARAVSLRFGPDFRYRNAAIVSLTTASAGDLPPAANFAAK